MLWAILCGQGLGYACAGYSQRWSLSLPASSARSIVRHASDSARSVAGEILEASRPAPSRVCRAESSPDGGALRHAAAARRPEGPAGASSGAPAGQVSAVPASVEDHQAVGTPCSPNPRVMHRRLLTGHAWRWSDSRPAGHPLRWQNTARDGSARSSADRGYDSAWYRLAGCSP